MAEFNIRDLKREISQAFDSRLVTLEKLSMPRGSKTIAEAKLMGVFMMRMAGYKNEDIAKEWGYTSGKTVSEAFSRAKNCYKDHPYFMTVAQEIANKFDITLK